MASKFVMTWVERLAELFVRYPKLLIAAVIIYFICPIDLLPEAFLGPVGYLDDLVVLMVPLLVRGYAKKLTGRSGDKKSRNYIDTTAR